MTERLSLTPPPQPLTPLETLTPREHEVLRLVAHGALNKHIALELGISQYTVRDYVSQIMHKLDAQTRCALCAIYFGVEPYRYYRLRGAA